ncbi:hypothetical protein SAMN05428981_101451 [Bacillus sp. OV194]|nr:hypothetical protein SAMN05428981_101451 [Bacillus sp. OV194]
MDIAEYAVKVRFISNKTLKGKLVQVQHGPATVIGKSSYVSTVSVKGWEGKEDC